ncbi:MAG: signal recognition particle protein [Thermoprotei archaeon]|nr:MAG: signal recognition particle protein [Thermoprotei archaeon]RLF15337.1 MAG: signal recognition particle protein [Thermoprotei archaeon]
MVLEKMASSLRTALSKFMGAPVADEKAVRELIRDVQRALLQSDVNVELVLKLTKKVEDEVLRSKPPPGLTRRELALKAIYEELVNLLGGDRPAELRLTPGKLNVIMLVGVQGSGKTTSAAKLALLLKRRGFKPALVCADNYRPAAYEQLVQLGKKIGIPVYGGDRSKSPVELAKEGVEKAKKSGVNVVIIDTAGRHKEEKGLIEEMKEIARAIQPDEVILVIDATIGQQAKAQAEAFHEAVKVGSIFLTKLDGAARGGGALSAVAATGATIKLIGVGEGVDELQAFNPRRFVNLLLGMGDLEALVEKVKQLEIKPEKKKVEALLTGRFTLKDMLEQLESLRKMGPFRKILELIPGLSLKLPAEAMEVAEEKLERWSAVLKSMTKEEMEKPEILNKSRIRRIARGSGVDPREVRELINQFNAMKRMFKQLVRRGKKLSLLGKPP